MKRNIGALVLTGILSIALLSGCGGGAEATKSESAPAASTEAVSAPVAAKSDFDTSKMITVVSREDGSGTRGAFIELFKVEEKSADGKKVDKTTTEAVIANKTDIVMNNVMQDKYAMGYISLGSLNDKVKAVKIQGVEASAANILNKSYKIARPFNIAVKGTPSPEAQDFINFILSKEGQEVVAKSYIPVISDAKAFEGTKPAGKIVVAGSSSVTPVMEKLKEAYEKVNPSLKVEIQMSDSTSGMVAAADGTAAIGMASRELKDSEKEKLTPIEIALDGIAVIVNLENPLENITPDQVKAVYTGKTLDWKELIK